jgi:ferredoxin--NADP+ reductase
MSVPRPLRVAIVGSGPAGFFAAEALLGRPGVDVSVDMFERLPAPFGLVRFGVAPDHQKIKSVVRSFDKVARRSGFRFFGNVDVGVHVTLADLARHYHVVCYATGAQTDRRLGVPGEDLARSHPATEFVAWYNGHPEFCDRRFDLSGERAAVIGVGNVAVDVARILCRTPDELAATDITPYAQQALAHSRIRQIYLLGRRGPVQAAFTTPEVRELGELAGADVQVPPEDVVLDPLSQARLAASDDRALHKKVEILGEYARRPRSGKPKLLTLRFLVSPVELLDDGSGGVAGMRLVRNRLEDNGRGGTRAVATERVEQLPVDLVFRSVGYRGVALPGLPFDERTGTVPNDRGRVLRDGRPLPGIYVTGWIKRGPSGVIGTNKPCAAETVELLLEDVARGAVLHPEAPAAAAAEALIRARQPAVVT